jgi:hypothetical protein
LTRHAKKLSYRLLSLLLATVWAMLTLLGAASMGRCRTSAATAKPAACAVSRCPMCHSLHPGGMSRCCCHLTRTSALQAMICARCDQGHPSTTAVLVWWPLVVPHGASMFATTPPHAEAFRHFPQALASLRRMPPTRPPRLL